MPALETPRLCLIVVAKMFVWKKPTLAHRKAFTQPIGGRSGLLTG
jgi:hypothetical protein